MIKTGSLSLTNGAQLDTSVFGKGNAGDITVNARDNILVEGVNKNGLASTIFTEIVNGASGNGGDININTGTLSVVNGGSLISNTRGQGNAGNILINAREIVTFSGRGPSNTSGAYSRVTGNAVGEGGNIEINTGSFSLTNTALIVTSTSGKGSAGNIVINARDSIQLDGTGSNEDFIPSSMRSSVETKAVGNSGNIRIKTGSLEVLNRSELNATTRGQGNAGNIVIQSSNNVVFNESAALTTIFEGATGIGGNIEITGASLTLINGSVLRTGTNGNGDSGDVRLNLNNGIFLDASGIYSNVTSKGFGNGGNIEITSQSLKANNESEILSSTSGVGSAGNITLTTRDNIFLNADTIVFSDVRGGATGKGGNITISTGTLNVTNGASLGTRRFGNGDAGNIFINARDSVLFSGTGASTFSSGAYSTVRGNGIGKGGNVEIITGSLTVNNGAQVAAGTRGEGDSGNVIINARDSIVLGGGTNDKEFSSAIFSHVEEGAVGKGGNIEITTASLLVTNGGQLLSVTEGKGSAGDILINAREIVSFDGNSLDGRFVTGPFSSVQETGIGNGGNIKIDTKSLSLTNGAQIVGVTRGDGDAGEITVNANSIVLDGEDSRGRPSGIFASTLSDTGRSGSIAINTNSLQLRNTGEINAATTNNLPGGDIDITANKVLLSTGGQIVTTTSSEGKAGNIRFNVTEEATLTNAKTGLFADTTDNSSGDGGNIFINLQTLNLSDQARISVGSQGTGRGGDIEIQASRVNFSNGAQISAQTRSSDGGNISLKANDILLMRKNSNISATAGLDSGAGNGGNIKINAGAIVTIPQENNDIRANAFKGRGGNVTINTNALLGIAASPIETFESNITASSEAGVQGEVLIQEPEVQPGQGLIELPEEVVDATRQVAQICPRQPGAKPLGEFTITGRGSLPPSPLEPLTGATNQQALATLEQGNSNNKAPVSLINNSPAPQIAEAQGWVKTSDGSVELVAVAPVVTEKSTTTTMNCPVVQ